MKYKNHMIIWIDAEKAFDQIQHLFIIKKKTLKEVGIKGIVPQHNKGYVWQANSILSGEKLKAFSLRSW